MDKSIFKKFGHTKLLLILIAISYVLLLFGNNMVSLTHPDEVFYTESAKDMVNNGKWFTPMIFHAPQFEKPFLFYSMMAALIKVFGISPAIARFWPGFFGVLGVCVTYWIALMLFKKKRLAFLSGFVLTSCFIYLALSRAVLTDVVFSIFVAISIGYFYRGYVSEDKRFSSTILFFIFAAIAVLTKGLLGITFTVGTVLIYLAYKKDLKLIFSKAVGLGLLLFLAITLPWHIAMYKAHGAWFLEEYFYNVHVRRLFVSEHPKINTWYFYPALMIVGVIPWIFFSIPAWITAVKKVVKKDVDKDKYFFLFSWIIGILLFVQPAQSKLASYIFPAFPAIAIIIAAYLDDLMEKIDKGEQLLSVRICGFLTTAVMVGVAICAVVFGSKYIEIIFSMMPMYALAVVALCIAAAIAILNLRRKHKAMIFAHISITAALLVCVLFARPYVEPWVSCKDVTDRFKKIDQSDSVVLASKFYVRAIKFYTDRKMAVIALRDKGFFSPHPIPFLNDYDKLAEFLKTQKVTYAIVKDGDVIEMKRVGKNYSFTVEELYGVAGKFILRIENIDPLKQY